MKYIITESKLNKLINVYLNSLKLKTEFTPESIICTYVDNGELAFDFFNNELMIDPYLVSMISGLFSINKDESIRSIVFWFGDKFEVFVLVGIEFRSYI